MRVLAIDTSSRVLGVAVLEEGGRKAEFNDNFGLRHASHLIPTIKKALKRTGLKLNDLDAYCVSIGPGSFTGLRIGVSTIKALALVTKTKIVAVPSLDVLAYNIPYPECSNFSRSSSGSRRTSSKANFIRDTKNTICIIVDAKKERLYACFYKYQDPTPLTLDHRPLTIDHRPKKISPYLLIGYKELFKRLAKIKNGILLTGDGIAKLSVVGCQLSVTGWDRFLRAPWNLSPTQQIKFADEKFWYPKAINTARIGLEMLKKGKVVKDIDSLVPVYLHPRDVQIK